MLIRCNSNENKIEIFYFDYEFTSFYAVTCEGIYSRSDLKRIVVFDKEKYKLLVNRIKLLKNYKSEYNVDVRRQLIINEDTICFDRFKQVLFNGVSKDTINAVKLYDLVDSLISEYGNLAKIYNKSAKIIVK